MTVKRRNKYSPELKAQIIELVAAGRPVIELSREYEIGQDLIYAWNRKAKTASASKLPQLGSGGAGAVGDQDAADELRELRRQVTNLLLENDILKKAAVILGTNPQPKSIR
jgi:transposase-like protein